MQLCEPDCFHQHAFYRGSRLNFLNIRSLHKDHSTLQKWLDIFYFNYCYHWVSVEILTRITYSFIFPLLCFRSLSISSIFCSDIKKNISEWSVIWINLYLAKLSIFFSWLSKLFFSYYFKNYKFKIVFTLFVWIILLKFLADSNPSLKNPFNLFINKI